MSTLAALSRRDLIGAAAFVAVGPGAAARKKHKRGPAPLAFAAATITTVKVDTGGIAGFLWAFELAIKHPASGYSRNTGGQVGYAAVDTPADRARGLIVDAARSFAADDLASAGFAVPEARIAVVLL